MWETDGNESAKDWRLLFVKLVDSIDDAIFVNVKKPHWGKVQTYEIALKIQKREILLQNGQYLQKAVLFRQIADNW